MSFVFLCPSASASFTCLLRPKSGAASFEGCVYVTFDATRLSLFQTLLHMWLKIAVLVSRIWRLHQMDPSWSQNGNVGKHFVWDGDSQWHISCRTDHLIWSHSIQALPEWKEVEAEHKLSHRPGGICVFGAKFSAHFSFSLGLVLVPPDYHCIS